MTKREPSNSPLAAASGAQALPALAEASPPASQALPADSPADLASAATGRNRRIWALALGTAAALQVDPALAEMAEMITLISCTANKTLAKDAISQMRAKAGELRSKIAPLPASALSKVVRRAEAACGAVLDKGVRVREVQTSWDQFMSCVQVWQERGRR